MVAQLAFDVAPARAVAVGDRVHDADAATDRWVAKINRLAAEIDDTAAAMHPSAWPEQLAPQLEQFKQLAQKGA